MIDILLSAFLFVGDGLPWPEASTVQHGVHASTYTGRHYHPEWEKTRRCIVKRESEGQYDVINPTGSYRGAYQVSHAMAKGMGWMIQKELRAEGVPADIATEIGRTLRRLPANKWDRFYQDMGFWLVWDDAEGRAHWANGRYRCGK